MDASNRRGDNDGRILITSVVRVSKLARTMGEGGGGETDFVGLTKGGAVPCAAGAGRPIGEVLLTLTIFT